VLLSFEMAQSGVVEDCDTMFARVAECFEHERYGVIQASRHVTYSNYTGILPFSLVISGATDFYGYL
jgi:hypothetical protein